MKILPIGFMYPNTKIQKTSAVNGGNYAITSPAKVDMVSFGRVAENAEKMRSMFKYGMIDIHTGQYIIDPEWFKKALQNNIFDNTLPKVMQKIKPLKKCLHKVETELFNAFEQISNTHPEYKLSDAIKELAPAAQVRLLELQRPIFNELKMQGHALPSAQKNAFKRLMETTEQQLENKPIIYKFSKKEFKYRLERIAQDTKSRGVESEIKTMDKLLKMSDKLPYTPSGRNFARPKCKHDLHKKTMQTDIIRQMANYLVRSSLSSDKALNDLFENAKRQLFSIPAMTPFARKTFIHELNSILNTIEDKKLAREMMKTACKLPTAKDEMAAFVVKASRYSSAKIGHDLLYGSVGDIDHLEPYSHGGADAIENYAYTTNAINSQRGNMTIERWIKVNPSTVTGAQKCIDRLLELYKEGVFEKEGFTPWYIIHFANKMKKLSKGELNLDSGTLFEELTSR